MWTDDVVNTKSMYTRGNLAVFTCKRQSGAVAFTVTQWSPVFTGIDDGIYKTTGVIYIETAKYSN
jgi:hypothetical protein